MATQVFFRSAVTTPESRWTSGQQLANLRGTASWWTKKSLSTSRGGAAANDVTSTVTGATAGVEVGATPNEYVSPPIDRDITISGTITLNLRSAESNMSANVAINAVFERIDGAGNITEFARTTRTTEITGVGTEGAENFTVVPTSTAFKKGDRLRIRVFGDDAGTMATGFTFTFWYNGPTAAASGDSYVTFTETFLFQTTDPAGSTLYLTDVAALTAIASPAAISGLVGWFDLSDTSKLWQDNGRTTPVTADGQVIGGITDQASGASHLGQGTAGNKPIYKASIQNGRGVGRFDGTDDRLTTAGATTLGSVANGVDKPYTVFVVASRTGDQSTSNHNLCSWWGGSAGFDNPFRIVGASAEFGFEKSDGTNPTKSFFSSGAAWTDTGFHVVEFVNTGVLVDLWKDGAQVANDLDNDIALGPNPTLFNLADSLNANPWKGDIGEIVVYNRALTEAERKQVETYLSAKWNTGLKDRQAWTSRGNGVDSDVVNTAAGPTAPIILTDTAGGTAVEWYTKSLTGFTLSGVVKVNLRALESNALANAVLCCQIAICDADGSNPVVWGKTATDEEMGTAESAINFYVSGQDTVLASGKRLRIRVYIDDVGTAAMAATYTVSVFYDGTSGGASGDTFIILPQTVTASGINVTVGQVTETDISQQIKWAPKKRLLLQPLETDISAAMGKAKSRVVGDGAVSDVATLFDTFDRANNAVLGTASGGFTWTEMTGGTDISSNQAMSANSGGTVGNLNRANSDLSVNHFAEIEFRAQTDTGTFPTADALGRVDSSVTSCYAVWYDPSVSKCKIDKIQSGVVRSTIATETGTHGPIVAGDKIKISCVGTTIKGFFNGVEHVSVVDSSLTTQVRTGFGSNQGGNRAVEWADNFAAGNAAAAAHLVETNTAQPITRVKSEPTVQVLETDLSRFVKAPVKVNRAIETDVVAVVARPKIINLGRSTENDICITEWPGYGEAYQGISIRERKSRTLVQVLETDICQHITKLGITRIPTQVVETDIATAITKRKLKLALQALETGISQSIVRLKSKAANQVLETDISQIMTRVKTKVIQMVTETDLAVVSTVADLVYPQIATTATWVTAAAGAWLLATYKAATIGTPITEIQNAPGSAAALSVSTTLGTAPTAGRRLVTIVGVAQSVAALVWSADSGYVKRYDDGRMAVFDKISDGSETTATFTISGVTTRTIRAVTFELSGAGVFDQVGSAAFGTAGTTTDLSTGRPIKQSDEWGGLLVVWNAAITSGSCSFSNGFSSSGAGTRGNAGSRIIAATGSAATTKTATLLVMDGFAHGAIVGPVAGSGFNGTYTSISGTATYSFDTGVKRTARHWGSLLMAQVNGTQSRLLRSIAAGQRILAGSFYFKCNAAPSTNSTIFHWGAPTNGEIRLMTDGTIMHLITGGTGTSNGINYADGQWHRIDMIFDSSGTTYTLTTFIDDIMIPQASRTGLTAGDITDVNVGENGSAGTLSAYISDLVIADDLDFPIGDHMVLYAVPNADGTHNLSSSISDEIGGLTSLYDGVDEWVPGTAPNTSDYIRQTAASSTAYAELLLGDADSVLDTNLWDVQYRLAGFASGTTVNEAKLQILDSGNNVLADSGVLDYSVTAIGYHFGMVSRPSGGWDLTKFNAAKARWGFSNNVASEPRLSALMVEYVVGPVLSATTKTIGMSPKKTRAASQVVETDLSRVITKPVTAIPVAQALETDISTIVRKMLLVDVEFVAENDTVDPFFRRKSKAIGMTTETDVSFAIAKKLKAKLVNQATETDIANLTGRLKTRIVGQSLETNIATALLKTKLKAVAQALETDLGTAMLAIRGRAVSQVIETDISSVMTRRKTKVFSQAIETDLATLTTRLKRKAFGQVIETDVSQPIKWKITRLVNRAIETDLATVMTHLKQKLVQQVIETDISTAMLKRKLKVIAQAIETDLGQIISKRKLKVFGQATETDLSRLILYAETKILGQATETDIAFAIKKLKQRLFGQVIETDIAQHLSTAFQLGVHQVTESDISQPMVRLKKRILGQPIETDIAQALIHTKRLLAQQVIETDLATVFTELKRKVLSQPIETDIAQPFFKRKLRAVGQSLETDAADVLGLGESVIVGKATEGDLARVVSKALGVHLLRATEIDLAALLTRVKKRGSGQAVENDIARFLTSGFSTPLDKVVETDLSFALKQVRAKIIARAIETDQTTPLILLKYKTIGQAVEYDLAFALLVAPFAPNESVITEATPEAVLTDVTPVAFLIETPVSELTDLVPIVVFVLSTPEAIITGVEAVPKALSREEVEMSLLRMIRGESAEWDVLVRHPITKQPINLTGKGLRFMAKREYDDENANAIIDVTTPSAITIVDPTGGLAHIKVPSASTLDLDNERTRLVYEFEVTSGADKSKSDSGYLVVNPQVVLP